MFNRLNLMAITLLMVSSLSANVVMIESVDQHDELNKGTLITMFTASWCGPCKQVKPHYKAFSDEFSDVTFCMIDVDTEELKEIDTTIKGMPTFVITHKGEELDRVTGGLPKFELRKFIAKNRAAAFGEEYKEEAPKLLTAKEYYKKGLKDYSALVEECQKKDVAADYLMGLLSGMRDEGMMILAQACMNSEETVEAFKLLKAYARGAKKALRKYKPHQKLQDATITFRNNCNNRILTASDYATYMAWQQAMTVKVQEKSQEAMWQLFAEASAE